MKLIEKNIAHVWRMEMNGMTYSYFVALKSGRVSDSRNFINYENGRTVAKEYPAEWLPVSVRKFIQKHDEELRADMVDGDGKVWRHYLYK